MLVVLNEGLPPTWEALFLCQVLPSKEWNTWIIKVQVQVLGEFFFSQIQRIPIYDHEGRRVGELRDLAIRWDRDTPKVTGIKYAKGVQNRLSRWSRWTTFNHDGYQTQGAAGRKSGSSSCSPMRSTWANG